MNACPISAFGDAKIVQDTGQGEAKMQRCLFVFVVVGLLLSVEGYQMTRADSPENPASCKQVLSEGFPSTKTIGNIEPVACFYGAMPTGVTVSQDGRIFVNFPRWGDKVEFTVAEVKSGSCVPYPNSEINSPNEANPSGSLMSVQSVVVDPRNRLWILDTGRIRFSPAVKGGPKLVGVDLKTDTVFQTITIPHDVALPTTYLNDVRFDLRRGEGGMAYITDSSGENPGIIVVDLATGESWRRLTSHESTKPDTNFRPLVEGRAFLVQPRGGPPSPIRVGADGIAISNDGKELYYCALSSWYLFSVSTDALADGTLSDGEVAATVKDLGPKMVASDGLESDAENNIYLTAYDQNSILRRSPDGTFETLVFDPRVIWPDTLSLATDGYLYFTANQLNRQPRFHEGKDLRVKPYMLFRVKVNAKPVMLR